MEISKSVITINDYGKITVHIKEIMDRKGITRNYLAKVSHTRFEVINRWYNGEIEKMDLDILARICYVLECSPADIIKYSNNVLKFFIEGSHDAVQEAVSIIQRNYVIVSEPISYRFFYFPNGW